MPEAMPPPVSPSEIAPAQTPRPSSLVRAAVGIVVVAALYFGREVFIPIVLAVLFSFVLSPLVNLLRGLHLGRAPSVIITVAVALGIILGLGSVIGSQVAQLATDLPRYQATISEKISAVRGATLGRASSLIQSFGREMEKAASEPPAPAQPGRSASRAEPAPKPMPVEIHQPDPTPGQLLRSYLGPILDPLAKAGIVLVVVIFILMQREDLRDRMIRLFGSSDLHRTTVAMDDAAARLSKYFLTQLALNAAFGVMIGAGLWLIGVPSPVLWGLVATLMRFVPYIGAFVAGAFPLALAAAVDPGWTMVLMTLVLFVLTEPLMGQVVEPLVYGHSTGLSPFAVVVSAIFWTWLWGPIGLILATPLTLCLVVLGRHVEHFEFFDVMLGDRPALTPIENFYQRMLAGDADEAQEHAEQLLKERSLSSYYDEVALKGLQLAANDAGRGVLGPDKLERIKDAIAELVDDLAQHEDVDPPAMKAEAEAKDGPADAPASERTLPKQPALAEAAPPPQELPPAWRGETAVLCIAGRGPLDEAASVMLAQLLRKHGITARVVPHEAVSRTNVMSLDIKGVAMVCISYLEISGSPAHLRYLLRRLRQKLPNAPILVGLWPSEEPLLNDPKLRTALGADYYVSSLRDGVKACLEAANKARDEKQGGDTIEAATERLPPPTLIPAAARA